MKKSDKLIISVLILALILSFFIDQFFINFSLIGTLAEKIIEFIFDYQIIFALFIFLSFYFFRINKKTDIVLLWSSGAITYLITMILKLGIARPRLLAEKLIFGIPNYSFPSAHTAIVFSILPLLMTKTKKIRWYWLTYAILIGISRIILQQHYLSDVIGGILLAYIVGITVIFLADIYIIPKINPKAYKG